MISARKRSEENELDKSTRILRAAERAFGEKGYEQSTITDIAKLANVSEGTIYEYFRNKEDLLFSIPEKRFRQHVAHLEEIFDIRSPLAKLERLTRDHFYLYLMNRNFLSSFTPRGSFP